MKLELKDSWEYSGKKRNGNLKFRGIFLFILNLNSMELFIELFTKIFVETILISGVIGFFFVKREEKMKKTIEEEFNKRTKFFDVRFNFKMKAFEELLAPIKLQLIRSKITLEGYDANNEYREKILKECNETVRGLLLQKGHLIPADLISYTEKFVKHYDEWLQAYREAREVTNNVKIQHVFTYNFPKDSEEAFKKKYDSYRKELAFR